ncbi:MAG: ATP-dependent helicase [Planctomycetaceae bacterium]|nr:ATP-dependent helicase [Planctomycetaceae bacterium]
MTSPRGKLPLGHDGYVKLWALSRPRLQFDFLLIDEAQDTNDVVLAVLEDQQCQVVYVGDKYQQIYEWRGAVNALEKIMTPRSCHLQRSFRFGPRIAMVANQLLDKLKSSKRIVGSSGKGSILNKIDLPDVLIGRTNAGILTTVADFRERGVKVFVEGGIDELKRLVRAVFELEEHGSCNAPEFFGFHSWDEVVRYSETDAGKDLVSFVSLVNSLGKKRLWRIICSCEQSADSAQVTVSTAHRSKGREWDRVRLLNDFVTPEIDESGNIKPLSDEDHRVLYVAVTRAKRELDLGENVAAYLGRTSRQANG